MSQGAPHPRMHGISHVSGGPDPIPGLLPVPTDYPGMILAEACLVHYWPGGEPSGDLLDRKGDISLERTAPHGSWPQHGAAGPFPGGTVVSNSGQTGLAAANTGRFQAASAVTLTPPFTVEVWAYLTRYPYTISDLVEVPSGSSVIAAAGNLSLEVLSAAFGGELSQKLYVAWLGLAFEVIDEEDFPLLAWQHLAARHDGTTLELFRNGTVRGSHTGASAVGGSGGPYWLNSSSGAAVMNGSSGHLALYDCALDDATIIRHSNMLAEGASGGGGNEGWVLELDENGNPVWRPPAEVTVNGDDLPNSNTPLPPWTTGLDDPTEIDPAAQWMMEQPFTWNGPEFEVPPRKWTTIPFTQPLMERQSNVTGGSTTWFELDWDDPASAGWVDPDEPSVITIPHDMPLFGDAYSWMQVCLKLEIPAVQPDSLRAIRIFETTHQKPILVSGTSRDYAGLFGGVLDLFRDATAHSLESDGEWFASGDLDGSGSHGNIMFVPNTGTGYYVPARDWLPKVGGEPTLKTGMRLLAQVWHDATETLTMDCSGTWPYRPHLVVHTPGQRAWGPPWSDWPEYEDTP